MKEACWPWQGQTRGGYGRVWKDGEWRWAHRVAYYATHGPIPAGAVILHSCDNPLCVNPAHLSVGSHAENAADRETKGRGNHAKGVRVAGAKLDDEKVREIRRLGADGEPYSAIAPKFDVSPDTVSLIVRGKTWRHLLQ